MMRDRVETISLDHPCAKCGYSLRTLRLDGVCPECGFDVSQSLADPEDRLVLLDEERILAMEPTCALWRRWTLRATCACATGFVLSMLAPSILTGVVDVSANSIIADVVILAMMASMLLGLLFLLAWWGFRARCHHAEFVKTARAGLLDERSPADRRRDDYVCRREEIYVRNIGAAKVLFWMVVVGVAMIVGTSAAIGRSFFGIHYASLALGIAFLALLVWINATRRRHARSIRYHRRQGGTEVSRAKAGAM